VLAAGDTVVFRAYVTGSSYSEGKPPGTGREAPGGTVTFNLVGSTKTLANVTMSRDNGLGGDTIANDGVFEVRYGVTGVSSNEITDAVVQAQFIDAYSNGPVVGNSRGSFSINLAPQPVIITSVTTTGNTATVTWQPSTSSDWASYDTYYSTDSLLIAGPECDTCMATPPTYPCQLCRADHEDAARSKTSVFIDNLQSCTQYYFRVFTHDTGGLTSPSNIFSRATIGTCGSPPGGAAPDRRHTRSAAVRPPLIR
jgi:hypothetical protein